MTAQLIGLTGRAGAGKDTVAAELRRIAWFERVAFADALKEAAYHADPLIEGGNGLHTMRLGQLVDLAGWDAAKLEYPDVRRYLQRSGVAMRNVLPGCWVNAAFVKIDALRADRRPVVVTDVRFPDEAAAIRAAGGVVIRLWREAAHDLGANAAHESERLVDTLDVDADIDNDGTATETAQRVLEFTQGRLA